MGIFSIFRKSKIDESMKEFKNKGENIISDKFTEKIGGEGFSELSLGSSFDKQSIGNLQSFYSKYIDKSHKSEIEKIYEYRNIAQMPEIADVIEDAVNESTQSNTEGKIIHLQIHNENLKKETIRQIIEDEFDNLFINRIEIDRSLPVLMMGYFVDGSVYYERLIQSGNRKKGIIGIKKLPSETMDFNYDPKTGKINFFYQYKKKGNTIPHTLEEANLSPDMVGFEPSQIGYIDYGQYGRTRKEIFGYLEKVKIPYNQLKLLETSVVIYRLIRAPERFVFKIDTGGMPPDKANKFVEKMKEKLTKSRSYDSTTGRLTNEPEVLSIMENYFLAQNPDGRGSDIETIGGNAAGFSELDDIYYFQRKLYRSLKYPQSRVSAMQENTTADLVFPTTQIGEISRDEIKWSKFLESHQKRFCDEFRNLFLLHLEFTGIKTEYEIVKEDISIHLTPPSDYKFQMKMRLDEARRENYMAYSNNEEFSKYFLMRELLEWDDEKIKANADGFQKDKDLGLKQEDSY